MARYEMRDTRYETGSALILAVVLTSLLAIVGVMFLMVARVDKVATSGISENKELDSAVETVVAKISQELALDVPRSDSNGAKLAEYYDYPGPADRWLASLEPCKDGTDYKWRQISDVTGFLADKNYDADDVDVDPPGLRKYIPQYPKISVDSDGEFLDENGNPAKEGLWADADGDGIADSKWIELDDITSNKGKPIYAAIRVIDNGGMINVNTVFADPHGADERKGDMLTDIYIDGLVKTGTNYIDKFIENRSGNPTITKSAAEQYHIEVSHRVENPAVASPPYTLYDISDELSLRNRFIIYHKPTITRLESKDCFGNSLRNKNAWTPVDDSDAFKSWERHVDPDHPDNLGLDPNESDNLYSFRKLLTTSNFDRIIDKNGRKMLNINDANVSAVYNTIIDANLNIANPKAVAAQIAVNLVDFRDNDSNVSTIKVDGLKYYGFERPCVYISEMVYKSKDVTPGGPIGAPPVLQEAYAIELYKPYSTDSDPCNWQIVIGPALGGPIGAPMGGTPYFIQWTDGRQFYVMRNDPCGILPSIDPCAVVVDANFILKRGNIIGLQRRIDDGNDVWIDVESADVPDVLIPDPPAEATDSIQRDTTLHKCIRRLWDSDAKSPTLGQTNAYKKNDSTYIQAHPADGDFNNVGEIGMLFRKSAYEIGPTDTEKDVRIDLADPCCQNLFQYLTVFDPSRDGINNDGDRWADNSEIIDEDELNLTPEWKVPGRININTAPWYVIAQLPWVSQRIGGTDYSLAQAIVAHRDDPLVEGFRSIGELMNVDEMGYYANDADEIGDLMGFPDLTPGDDAEDDFEERDVIFSRISNLVTVRSDVFTAYILVRIGTDGPQKRVIAIFDRSNVYSSDDKVRIIALHPVPDPR